MDPEACLLAAEAALEDLDVDAFLEAMRAYAGWRRCGGFEPTVNGRPGDAFYGLLSTRFGSVAGNREGVPSLD
jgi:hypothetical protein